MDYKRNEIGQKYNDRKHDYNRAKLAKRSADGSRNREQQQRFNKNKNPKSRDAHDFFKLE